MPDAFATIIAALIGAGSGSLGASYFTHRREKSKEEHQRRERIVQRYLLQLQDAVDSLWFRFENESKRGGRSAMEGLYYEISTLYAWGRVIAYSRILLLDGIYPQLEYIENGLGQCLRDYFYRIDQTLKDKEFQHYHRLALAEAVMVREEKYLRTSTYLEFCHHYVEKDSLIRSSLQPAKDYIVRLKGPELKDVLGDLALMAKRIEKVTTIPSKIEP